MKTTQHAMSEIYNFRTNHDLDVGDMYSVVHLRLVGEFAQIDISEDRTETVFLLVAFHLFLPNL